MDIDSACLSATRDELSPTIEKIAKLINMSNHTLYRDDVYVKPVETTAAYIEMTDVGSYINKLLVNQALRAMILKHLTSLVRILSQHTRSLGNWSLTWILLKFPMASFSRYPREASIQREKFGIISPRTFIPYNCTKCPEAGYFSQGIFEFIPG